MTDLIYLFFLFVFCIGTLLFSLLILIPKALASYALYWTKKQDKDDRRSADMICRIN